ncbi:MAG: T9SS type A sorting domain-containing protein [Bacteroidota bacterium]
MDRSIRYLFLLLLTSLFFGNLASQSCLNVEYINFVECQPTSEGTLATITVIVTPIDTTQQGQWQVIEGSEGGQFGVPTQITVELEDLATQLFLQVQELDNPDCVGFLTIANPCFNSCPLDFAVQSITPGACDGSPTGILEFSVDNVSPPFVIEVYGPQGFVATLEDATTLTGVATGVYSAILYDVTDLCQETIQFFVPIEDSDLEVEIFATPNPGGGVLLTAVPSGGVPPYDYIWTDGSVLQSIVITQPGDYVVQVFDAGNCSAEAGWVQEEEVCLLVEANITDADCGQSNGAIDITLPPDTDGVSFSWSNGQQTEDLIDVPAGIYTLTISNGVLCTQVNDYLVGLNGPTVDLSFATIFNPCALMPGPAEVQINYPDGQTPGSQQVIWVNTETGDTLAVDPTEFYPDEAGDYQVYVNFLDQPDCNYTEIVSWNGPTFEIVQDDFFQDSIPCFGEFYYFEFNGEFIVAELTLPDGSTIISEGFDAYTYGPGLYIATPLEDICPGQDDFELIDSILVLPEDVECETLSGTVYIDANGDCTLQTDEQLLGSRLIKITNTTTQAEFYAYTDLDGEWTATLPLASYELEVLLDNTLFENCLPLTTVDISSGIPADDINLGIQPTGDLCPQLTVNLTIPLIRRCFFSNIWVYYENTGTVTAEDAQIIVDLGDWTDEISQSGFGIPYDSIVPGAAPGDPTLVYFSVGDVPPFGTGNVSLLVKTCNPDIPLGAAVCVRAMGLPNNPCPPADNAWGGASLRVDGRCTDEGEVSFKITNVGLPMLGELNYVITEDAVMLRQEEVPGNQLDNEPYFDQFDATGATYHILVDQEPNHPGLTMPTAFVEGCTSGNDQDATYGFALQIPPNSDAFWVDEDCLEVIGAYDPNDKLAEPRGYGDDNFIEPGVPVEYTIRFQNTGTDTAFNVFIRDTLHPLLDPSTIELGAASHRFRADIDTAGAINFFFDNIMLPDSFVNEPASHGAVSFTILPKAGIQPGTPFTNRAGIYFDFNEPIITNDYLLTIEQDFISTSIFEWSPRATELRVYPNPTQGPAWIELPDAIFGQELEVTVIDMLGRQQLLYTYGPTTERPGIDLGQLAQGWYVLQLRSGGELLGVGRVLLE